jgi:hypothetical protein
VKTGFIDSGTGVQEWRTLLAEIVIYVIIRFSVRYTRRCASFVIIMALNGMQYACMILAVCLSVSF